jgi:hypothetical protein
MTKIRIFKQQSFEFGYWNFKIVWGLAIGIWDFKPITKESTTID